MVKKIVLGVVSNALALYAVTWLLADVTYTGGIKFFLLGGFIIGILNTFVKPLMKLLSLPIVFLTAGLFIFVINTVIFWLTVKMVNGINLTDVAVNIQNPLTYFLAALVFGLVNWILNFFLKK